MEVGKTIQKWSLYALLAGGVSFVIAWLFTNIGLLKDLPTLTMAASDINVRQQIASGISPSFGQGVLNFFSGYIPLTLTGFLAVLITAYLVIVGGALFYEGTKKYFSAKGVGKILLVFLYAGAIFVGLSMFLFKMPFSLAVWATLIYYAVLSIVMYVLSLTKVKQLDIPD